MTEYRQSVDLGGQSERVSAIIEVTGDDERVLEALGRLHIMLSNLRADMDQREKAGTRVPCPGCGDK